MTPEGTDPLERSLLLHLLEHRGAQVRFEADQWTTEFGIFRKFDHCGTGEIKQTLRSLEMSRWIYQRVQYVVGYSEPKLVYSLTPSGHRKALDIQREEGLAAPSAPDDVTVASGLPAPTDPSATLAQIVPALDGPGNASGADPPAKPRGPRGRRRSGSS